MKSQLIQIDVYVDENDLSKAMMAEIRQGLRGSPKEISPKYFYDERGSALFERITELPEYYQPRTERGLLEEIAPSLAREHGFDELFELGSGSSAKTRVLLGAMSDAGTLRRYIPFDVSESMVRRTMEELSDEHPDLELHGVVGDFTRHLDAVPSSAHRLVVFLGGTIGNFDRPGAIRFLGDIARTMKPTDRLLLGTDLVKSRQRLEAAYNDSEGVTAEFNLNVLRFLNRQLSADFDPNAFAHVAFFNEKESRIEMWLRSLVDQRVRVRSIDLQIELARDEAIRTEISCKYTRGMVSEMLEAAGLTLKEWYTDPDEAFALSVVATG